MKALLHGIAEGDGRTLHNLLDLLIFIGGDYLLGRHTLLLTELSLPAPIVLALEGGLLYAFGTTLGTMPVLMVRTIPARLSDALLGFSAGVMLSTTAFSPIMPTLSATGDLGYSKFGTEFLVNFGLVVGVIGLFILDRLIPGVHLGCEGASLSGNIPPRTLPFVTAIVLYNTPEDMAVGVSAGAGLDEANGLALGIALQDVPEGLVVALVLAGIGVLRFKAILVDAASGLVEPLFAVLYAWLVGLSTLLPPWGLATAMGAMLSVVTHEITPESHRQGHTAEATPDLVFDFCLTMVLGTALD